jgi:hypothetical protein
MEDFLLKDIKHECHENERVCDWTFIEIHDRNVRVYYKPNEQVGLGFNFYAVENTGGVCTPEYDKDNWNADSCFVRCLFQGIAYFDGIRHLYMGDELTCNFGYHFYPSLETSVETLKVIRELEKKYCRDYE